MTQNFDELALETPEQEATRLNGESLVEGGADATPAFDAGAFEASTLAAVAEANEATVPTPEVEAEIAQIEQELRGGAPAEDVVGEVSPTENLEQELFQESDIANFTSRLEGAQGKEMQDSVVGTFEIRKETVDLIKQMNLDLGQAMGLMKDGGTYEGTPKRIVDETINKLHTLPPAIQRAYRKVVTDYVNGEISKMGK